MGVSSEERGRDGIEGALAGGLAALAALGLEQALMVASGLPALAFAELVRVGVTQGALGFALGAVLGVAGLRGLPLLWGLWAAGVGAVAGGKLVGWGYEPHVFAATWPAAAAVAGVCSRVPERWSGPLWVAAAWCAVAAASLNLNVFGAPAEPAALLADGGVAAVGLAIAVARIRATAALGASLVVMGMVVGLWPRQPPTVAPGTADGPPVLLVVIDTLRADRLGFMGYDRETSPGLDRLAERGRVYEQAQAAAPWTLPSFASLLTGLDPSEHGAGVNRGAGNTRSALAGIETVPERMAAAGYATAAFTTNPYLRRAYGLDRGFQLYDDEVGWGYRPLVHQPLSALGWPGLAGQSYRRAPAMVAAVEAFVDDRPGAWFVMLHLMEPHGPFTPDRQHVRGSGLSELYDAEIRTADAALLRLWESLPDDTLIIVTADHGEELGEGRPHDPVPAGTRHGHTQYQELLHVPLLVVGPGIEAGRVSEPVRQAELGAWIAQWIGLEGAEPVNSHAIVSEAILFGREQKAVRLGRWKLVDGPAVRLFDLDADPDERHDLAGAQPARVEAMRELLPASGRQGPAPQTLPVQTALEVLGYVEGP